MSKEKKNRFGRFDWAVKLLFNRIKNWIDTDGDGKIEDEEIIAFIEDKVIPFAKTILGLKANVKLTVLD